VGAFDWQSASDDERLIYLDLLDKRSSYEAFCFDTDLFGDEVPARAHRVICQGCQMVLDGEIERLMIFAPPGVAKSTYVSKRFVAYAAGYAPGIKIIGASHTASLAAKHGRESRNIIDHPAYKRIFPEVRLAADMKARDDWATNEESEFFGCGFDGTPVGRRGDIVLIDDPFKGRKDADSETIRQNHWEFYSSGLRTRRRKGGRIILMHQRWHEDDIAGRILPDDWAGESGWVTAKDGEEWYVINLQMIAEAEGDLLDRKPGELLWPEWFDPKRVEQDRISAGTRDWNAMYQGVPSSAEGAIIKPAWWRKWPGMQPPVVDYLVQVLDTAFEEGEEDDYSARTTWGVFDIYAPANAEILSDAMQRGVVKPWTPKGEVHQFHAILLERWKGKVAFPELKRVTVEGWKFYRPDRVLIEKRASGHSLLQELKRTRVPVKAIKADRSKLSRTYAAQPAFEQGTVWHMDRRWAAEVIRECAQFPTGKYMDIHDTVVHAINWLRRTYHVVHKGERPEDHDDDQDFEDGARGEIAVAVD
jgi:predicted phage terminase large subunit-like protein